MGIYLHSEIKDEMWSQRLCPLCNSRQFSVRQFHILFDAINLENYCNIRNDSVMYDL